MQYDRCSAFFFKVYYGKPILCNSISPDGSQFVFVPQPGQVAIVSATPDPATCAAGHQLGAGSSLPHRSMFLIHVSCGIQPGSDGRNLRDTCNLTPPLALPLPEYTRQAFGCFNAQVNWGCVNDDIVLTHPVVTESIHGHGISAMEERPRDRM